MAWELSLVKLNVSHAVSRNQLKVLVLRAKKSAALRRKRLAGGRFDVSN